MQRFSTQAHKLVSCHISENCPPQSSEASVFSCHAIRHLANHIYIYLPHSKFGHWDVNRLLGSRRNKQSRTRTRQMSSSQHHADPSTPTFHPMCIRISRHHRDPLHLPAQQRITFGHTNGQVTWCYLAPCYKKTVLARSSKSKDTSRCGMKGTDWRRTRVDAMGFESGRGGDLHK